LKLHEVGGLYYTKKAAQGHIPQSPKGQGKTLIEQEKRGGKELYFPGTDSSVQVCRGMRGEKLRTSGEISTLEEKEKPPIGRWRQGRGGAGFRLVMPRNSKRSLKGSGLKQKKKKELTKKGKKDSRKCKW